GQPRPQREHQEPDHLLLEASAPVAVLLAMADQGRIHSEPTTDLLDREGARLQQLGILRTDADRLDVGVALQQGRLAALDGAPDVLLELLPLLGLKPARDLVVDGLKHAVGEGPAGLLVGGQGSAENLRAVADDRHALLTIEREARHSPDAVAWDFALPPVLLRVPVGLLAVGALADEQPVRVEKSQADRPVGDLQLLAPGV